MFKKIGILLMMLVSAGIMAQTVANWKFKDGTGSDSVTDSSPNSFSGSILNPGNCEWARADDRGFFLTISTNGAVKIPHNAKLNFTKGFIAEIYFSCNFDLIDSKVNYASLLTKGYNFDQGYCIMVQKNGNLLIDLHGMTPEYTIIEAKIQNSVDSRLMIAVGNGEVSVFMDGKRVANYAVTGELVSNSLPLSIGAINGLHYPFNGNIYEVKLSEFDNKQLPREDIAEKKVLPEFVPYPVSDPAGTIIFNDLSLLVASDGHNIIAPWIIRSNVAFMGDQTTTVLQAAETHTDTELEFDPKLKGRYDIYAGVRAAHIPMSVQIKTSDQKDYYTLNTASVGQNHRNMELLLGRDIKMDGNRIQIAATDKICYLGYIKFIPADNRRTKENPPDPAGSVLVRPKYTSKEIDAGNEKIIAQRIKNNYFIERTYVEKKKEPELSAKSTKRGYIIFKRNYLDLVFPVTVPEIDQGEITLKTAATPGEYEPCSFAVRCLQDICGLTLRLSKEFKDNSGKNANISALLSVVESTVKRTSNYTGESEFMVGPQYLEPVTQENLKKGETRQFWITFHVADDVASGVYRAELELASNGHIEKIPVEFQVYPFKLRAIENLDIGFWLDMQSYNNPNGKDGIDRDIKDMAEHGINSVVVQSSLIINGKTLDALKIDFEKSLLTAVAESFKKYKMNGYLHLMTQQIWEYVMTFPEGERRQAYTKLITLLEDYAKKNNWPKRAYQSYDEVLSSPGNLPEFIREVKLQRELGLTTSDDHIWYKTCRPFQKEVDEIASSIDIFINRYNNRRLFYVNSWEEMLAQAVKRGTKLYTYNTTNCMTFAQLAAMRCLGGWFFRTVGKGCSGQLFWTYKLIQGNPYNDLDGEIGDFLCQYPPYGKRKGGPAIDWEAHREGIDDLRYVITLEHLISQARKENRISEADAAQKVLDSIAGSFDWNKFREKSIYWDSKWTEAWEHNGKRYAAGQYNIPNGWTLEDYDLARHRIADEIIKLQSKK